MTGTVPTRVIVEAPARLHLGFIDLNGSAGRLFGSIGVGLECPRYVVEVRRAARNEIDPEIAADVSRVIRALGSDVRLPGPIAARVLERVPRHQGLGSGTQRDLALGSALSRLSRVDLSAQEIAARLGRGRRSGVGIATFERGGFVVDAGVACGRVHERGTAVERIAPVIFQRPLPEDWVFVLASPGGEEGVHGSREEAIFRDLVPMSEAVAARISRLVLVKALPAIVTDDVVEFGSAITEIQELVGQEFAPYQAGVYASECGRAIAEFARSHGAAGVGQSSWGPTVFALVRGTAAAIDLVAGIRALAGNRSVTLWHTRASARGAVVRAEP